ncbi:sirohydrochlorin chelatase [Leifsonia sp. 2MCAF36]|uniref:sirohydrochlorin chelatase n=1 Tax=Leifsonia sp. 2MCAF36 TaxID=3232988 RepID=UPI003F95ED57
MTDRTATAAVLASHGTASADGQLAVRRLVERVAASLPFPVLGCHVDVEQPDVASTLASAAALADRAIVVPLLLSAGFHVFVDLADSAAASPIPTTVSPALGPDIRLVQVLATRLLEAGYRPGDEVVLAAAGSTDRRAVADCHRTASLLAGRLAAPVTVGFISAATPSLPEAVSIARRRTPDARVLIATYLLAPGYFATLTKGAGADLVSSPLLTPESTPQELIDVVVDRVEALALVPR